MKKDAEKRQDVILWLNKKGWTQKDWARTLGIDHMTIYNWIRGAKPHQIYLDRIKEVTPDCPILQCH